MKAKAILIVLLIALCTALTACDSNDKKNLDISEYKYYIDNTEHYDISTYNGYKCTNIDKVRDNNGKYTVTFEFEKVME